ncbi:MAG: HEPN domain-containing protein [Steroidobacteraceae bacterium]
MSALSPFARHLVRKGERAIRSARLGLQDGDSDGAVNRAYYAMFNVARAALLSAGVAEDGLPRTHRGVIAAFGQHAVQSGRMDADLASTFNRTEALRLKADYTGEEIDVEAAAQVVERAEVFVRTVERVFGLETLNVANIKQVSPLSLEEQQPQGRETWLLQRQSPAVNSPSGAQKMGGESSAKEHDQDLGLEDDAGL